MSAPMMIVMSACHSNRNSFADGDGQDQQSIVDLHSSPPTISAYGFGVFNVNPSDVLHRIGLLVTYTVRNSDDFTTARGIVEAALTSGRSHSIQRLSSAGRLALPGRKRRIDVVALTHRRGFSPADVISEIADQLREIDVRVVIQEHRRFVQRAIIDPAALEAATSNAHTSALGSARQRAHAEAQKHGLEIDRRASSETLSEHVTRTSTTVEVRVVFACTPVAPAPNADPVA